ncbi:MAG: hypothetical protein CMG00_09080 [Candidatus Marinimicrobia bacterium]|nr:hypothetical protein [Candidatus Neomarinimicrobiota bacterium]|tara:strand:- start:6637 stop:7578 length:942 start_codon:yes stop_codon:yes gene_type:complete
MHNNINIIICVPTYKRPVYLKKCLNSLIIQEFEGDYKIAVIDNDVAKSAYSTVQKFKNLDLEVSYHSESKRGIAAVRNTCIKVCIDANATHLVFIDDDEFAEKNWLENILNTLIKYQAKVVAGPVLCNFEVKPPRYIEEVFFKRKSFKTGYRLKNCATGNVILDMEIFKYFDGPPFNESFGLMGGSDSDFFKRLKKENVDFIWSSEAVAHENISNNRSRLKSCLIRAFNSGNSSFHLHRFQKTNFVIIFAKVLNEGLKIFLITLYLCVFSIFIFNDRFKAIYIKKLSRLLKKYGFIAAFLKYKNNQYNITYGK